MQRAVQMAMVAITLLVASTAAASTTPAQPLPDAAAILADGKRAAESWAATIPLENCAWTGGTYVLGLLEYHKATVDLSPAPDAAALAYVRRWAEEWQYKICVGWRQESGCVALAADTAYTAGPMWNVSGVKSVDDCCDLADSQQRAGCWGYTYRAAGGVCSLHTNDTTTAHEAGAVSGWVRQGYGFPPPPAPPFSGKPKPEGTMVNPHSANEQLCGAIYAELYKMDGGTNESMLADTAAVLSEEVLDPSSSGLWSWVDALHMAMSTYSRMGNVTGGQETSFWRYFTTTENEDMPRQPRDKHRKNFINECVFRRRGQVLRAAVADVQLQQPLGLPRKQDGLQRCAKQRCCPFWGRHFVT